MILSGNVLHNFHLFRWLVFQLLDGEWNRVWGRTRVFRKTRVFSANPGFGGRNSVLPTNPGNFKGLEGQGIYILYIYYIYMHLQQKSEGRTGASLPLHTLVLASSQAAVDSISLWRSCSYCCSSLNLSECNYLQWSQNSVALQCAVSWHVRSIPRSRPKLWRDMLQVSQSLCGLFAD